MTPEEFKAKFYVGQLVWCPSMGFCEIKKYNASNEYPYRFTICPVEGKLTAIFTEDGKEFPQDKHPTLLTVEEAAKLGYFPPKKKVKKKISRWVNYYPTRDEAEGEYSGPEAAKAYADHPEAIQVEMVGEVEVDDE